MNFLPAIPQVSQQNQGIGYGNWQQYAGYNKDNPFGGSGGLNAGVKPPSTTKSTGTPAPVTDYSQPAPVEQAPVQQDQQVQPQTGGFDPFTYGTAPGEQVYRGQVIGENSRYGDIEVNIVKGKKLTNMRASGSDEGLRIAPKLKFSLEESMEQIKDDEYLEITPLSLRMRKVPSYKFA